MATRDLHDQKILRALEGIEKQLKVQNGIFGDMSAGVNCNMKCKEKDGKIVTSNLRIFTNPDGTEHRKYMRMMPVYVRITAPLYWWKEFDTYKVGTVANSCSTMHKIAEKEFTLEDFSCEHLISGSIETLNDTIDILNEFREWYLKYDHMNEDCKKLFNKEITCKKDLWWQLIQLLPSSYNQTRNVMLNYEVLANIYRQRKNHKLDEWREVCKWIESLPYSELITGKERQDNGRQ